MPYQHKLIHIAGWDPDVRENMTTVPQFTWVFDVARRSIFRASGHIDYRHKGLYGTENTSVMVAHALTLNGRQIQESRSGDDIDRPGRHYATLPVFAFKIIEPGAHIVRLKARSASSDAPGKNGLAEIKGGYNGVVYEVFDYEVD